MRGSMNVDRLYNKAAQLLERSNGEDNLMRNFYLDLARSYHRIAWEIDPSFQRSTKRLSNEQRSSEHGEALGLLGRLADSNGNAQRGVSVKPDET